MSFLTPLFLLGGLAIALPVVFHLVRRSTRDKMVFSSLMFLKPTPPRMTRRNKLEHIFLLLLRCLVLCLLATGFSRPFLQKPMANDPAGQSGARIVLLVDTSASMRREGVWPGALAKAEEVLAKSTLADQVTVFTFDNQVRSVVGFEEWTRMNASDRASLTAQRLAANKPTWLSTHLGNALISAAEALEDADKQAQHNGPRRIVVITDLQEGSRLDGLQGYDWPRGIEVAVETIKAKKPTNAGLQWVMDADDVSPTVETGPRLRVSNASDARREQFQIRWEGVAGASTVDAYIPPGQSRIVQAPKLPPGATGERIALTGDDEDFDNIVHLVQPKAEEVNVLFLGEDAEKDSTQLLYYLKRAFQDTRRQSVRVVADDVRRRTSAETNIPPPHVGGYNRLVIVSGALPEDRLAEVRQFVAGGGTALLVLKDAASGQALVQLAESPDVSVNEGSASGYSMFGKIDFEHPLFAPFADPRFSDFTKIHFWKHRRIHFDKLPDVRVVASFDNGDPALVEISKGRGRLLVLASSWRPADSQLALSSKFIPLLYSVLEQAGGIRAQLAQYRVGDTADLTEIAAKAGGKAMQITRPDGSRVQLAAGEKRFSQTDQPGIYEIEAEPPVRFAVNLDPAESRTAPLPVEELERLNLPVKPREVELAKQAELKRHLHNSELESQQKLWRWLIVAALAVLLVETWLAGRLTRGAASTQTTEATV